MKILFIRNTTLGQPEAADAHFFPIALSNIDHDITMVARKGGNGRILRDAGVDVFEVGKEQNWLITLRKLIRSKRPDIVHVFIHAGCGLYPFIAKTTGRVKFVLDIRSPLLKTGLIRRLVQFKNRFEPYGYNAIIAHGIESAQTVIGKKFKMHWVPPGVDISLFPEKRLRKEGKNLKIDPVRLVYIGSLAQKRKTCQMIEAVMLTMQNKIVLLDVFGEGSEKDKMISMAEQKGFDRQIHFHGSISREKLFKQLPLYDIGLSYVPSSLYDKAPPLKTLEFMAAYLPVVATNTVGNKMFIEDGVNGILAKESPREYAEGIRMLIDAPWRKDSPQRARKVAENYDWQKLAREKLLPIYQCLMK